MKRLLLPQKDLREPQEAYLRDGTPKNLQRRFQVTTMLAPLTFVLLTGVFSIPLLALKGDALILFALVATMAAELVTAGTFVSFTWGLEHWRRLLGVRAVSKRVFLQSIGLGVVAYVALQLTAVALAQMGVTMESSDTSVAVGSGEGVLGFITLFVLAPFVVPLVEEIFFRGLLYKSFQRASTVFPAASSLIGSSLLFSLAHFQGMNTATDILMLVWIFLLAVVLWWWRRKHHSIVASYGVHMAYNLTTALAMAFLS